jgi:hypothetical protein
MPQGPSQQRFDKDRRDNPPLHCAQEPFRIETSGEVTDHLAAVVRDKRRLRFKLGVIICQQIGEDLPIRKKPFDRLTSIGRVAANLPQTIAVTRSIRSDLQVRAHAQGDIARTGLICPVEPCFFGKRQGKSLE